MKKFHRLLLAASAMAVAALAVVPSMAQDDGLIVIEGNFGGDPATFNLYSYASPLTALTNRLTVSMGRRPMLR